MTELLFTPTLTDEVSYDVCRKFVSYQTAERRKGNSRRKCLWIVRALSARNRDIPSCRSAPVRFLRQRDWKKAFRLGRWYFQSETKTGKRPYNQPHRDAGIDDCWRGDLYLCVCKLPQCGTAAGHHEGPHRGGFSFIFGGCRHLGRLRNGRVSQDADIHRESSFCRFPGWASFRRYAHLHEQRRYLYFGMFRTIREMAEWQKIS